MNRKRQHIKCLLTAALLTLMVLGLPALASAASIVDSGTIDGSDNLSWSIDSDGVVVITGEGSMGDYTWSPWEDANVPITKVIIWLSSLQEKSDASITTIRRKEAVLQTLVFIFWLFHCNLSKNTCFFVDGFYS